ncbi:hypothetical protein C2G38_569466 [Gigaspora rosea]|uniref:Uncharacterized protein n=1 Tax=Gigaspora rosea TaxID=44941 RepID=A0A397U9L1_9GLOM|nr:hypothetical protein C2G38_569466 [Gigaspora rosea]
MNRNLSDIKTNAYNKAGKIILDQKIYDEVDKDISSTSQILTTEINSSTLKVKEEIKKIEIKITSLKSTARNVAQDIVSSTKTVTQALKQGDTPVIASQNVNNEQKESTKESKESDKVPPLVVQTPYDPVLNKLKSQYDPVLQKLQTEYKKTKENKQSEKIAKGDSH